MKKKLTESKTYVSADGKVAKTYYPDGKLVVQFSRHGGFTGPRDPRTLKNEPVPKPTDPPRMPQNIAQKPQPERFTRRSFSEGGPEPKKPTFREQPRTDLGLDQFKPKR